MGHHQTVAGNPWKWISEGTWVSDWGQGLSWAALHVLVWIGGAPLDFEKLLWEETIFHHFCSRSNS